MKQYQLDPPWSFVAVLALFLAGVAVGRVTKR